MTGIILGLSLSLAFSLIAFMIGIVLWRRKRRKREKDMEKTAASIDTRDAELDEGAQRVRSKQRMWQRASAKWMANVKHSARRRRKRGTTVATRPSDTDLLSDKPTIQASTSAVSLTRTQTRTGSDHDSAYSARPPFVPEDGSRPPRTRSPSIASTDNSAVNANADPESPPPFQPPAYIPNPSFQQTRSVRHSPPNDAPSGSRRPRAPSSDYSFDPSVPLPYEPPIHSAHVATDDKAVLAEMARLASAPPGDGSSMSGAAGGSSETQPSVPVLEEDPFELLPQEMDVNMDVADEYGIHQGSNSAVAHDSISSAVPLVVSYSRTPLPVEDDVDLDVPSYAEDAIRHPTLVLPLPPRKVPLTGPMFYEYPHEFEEDVVSVEPPYGPSSPPFEEPSALPFAFAEAPDSEHMIAPSAPPLEIEDEPPYAGDLVPSAPPLDEHEQVPVHDAASPSAPSGQSLGVPSTATPGSHANVSRDAVLRAARPRQAVGNGDDASPPQYLP